MCVDRAKRKTLEETATQKTNKNTKNTKSKGRGERNGITDPAMKNIGVEHCTVQRRHSINVNKLRYPLPLKTSHLKQTNTRGTHETNLQSHAQR
jgi:hypothetical protein